MFYVACRVNNLILQSIETPNKKYVIAEGFTSSAERAVFGWKAEDNKIKKRDKNGSLVVLRDVMKHL